MTSPIKKLLIANRGEPVIRAFRTLRRLGIETGVVFAPEDASQDWIGEVDLAFGLRTTDDGRRTTPYVDGPQIIAIAQQHGFDAMWPAWGFLAEDAHFAQAVLDAGLIWVGPPPAAMRALASKDESSAIAKRTKVPTIPEMVITPGSTDDRRLATDDWCSTDDGRRTTDDAVRLGFPLLIKPALGGGGQGQKIIRAAEELPSAYAEVARINAAQFQNGPIVLQRYLENARHIEAQVLADHYGNVVVFHERECSIQRRNQKIIEESPSPAMTPELRAGLQAAARRLAMAVGYASAGTLEFLLVDDELFFLEMNTRLQVEHPITEETTRWVDGAGTWRKLDLIEEMVRVARGERLRFDQAAIRQVGHAIEARLYAEDPVRNFHPAPGWITSLRLPYGEGIRVDSALLGSRAFVDPRYDPMIGKLIAWGEDREEARQSLRRALQVTGVAGIPTNIAFLHAAVSHDDFRSGAYTTGFVADHMDLARGSQWGRGVAFLAAAVATYHRDRKRALRQMTSGRVTNVAAVLAAVPPNGAEYQCDLDERRVTVRIGEWGPDHFAIHCDGRVVTCHVPHIEHGQLRMILSDGAVFTANYAWREDQLHMACASENYVFAWRTDQAQADRDPHAAPGGGRIVQIAVVPGDTVAMGDLLYVTEAMKMEARVTASAAGRIEAVCVEVGESVEEGQTILTIASSADVAEERTPVWRGDELSLPVDHSPVAPFVLPSLTLLSDEQPKSEALTAIAQTIVARYLQGYDIPADAARIAATYVTSAQQAGVVTTHAIAEWLADQLEFYWALQSLFGEDHTHALVYFIEHIGKRERPIPKATEALIARCLRAYAVDDLNDSRMLRHALFHAFQAARHHGTAHGDFLLGLVEELALCDAPRLTKALTMVLAAPFLRAHGTRRRRWQQLVQQVDAKAFYAVERPPVAPQYRELYEQSRTDPLTGLVPDVLRAMREAALTPMGDGRPFGACRTKVAEQMHRLFPETCGRPLPVGRRAADAGVQLYHVQREGQASRVIAIAEVKHVTPVDAVGRIVSMPNVERAAIEACWMLRAYQSLGLQSGPNHLFLFFPDDFQLPWRKSSRGSTTLCLTPGTARRVCERIGGFAADLQIPATEIIAKFEGFDDWAQVEIWHVRGAGYICRPPHPVDGRPPVWEDGDRTADQRQRRLGKLLNVDRARLLFDDGQFEELFFPEVDLPADASANRRPTTDDRKPIGLNVYRGQINGAVALAYAGDFRLRGGALGEREGKKLASTVVLAYAMQVPLVAIHDGAGADIQGSVASLGWAGAYFGALAATSGHASADQFRAWYDGHHNREYFEKVLQCFGHCLPTTDDGRRTTPLLHLHLHLGAAVGMLVYGPSISSCSLMADHPAVYRLLTGAATVAQVTGEKSTNYDLGGAPTHGRLSGEIDFVLGGEEEVIEETRELLACLQARATTPTDGTIARDASRPLPTIPVSAGVVVGVDAIRANVDRGRFWESRRDLSRAGGLMTGYAQLAGQPVMLAATTTDYGMHHGRTFKKMQMAASAATDFGLPLLVVCGDQWDHLEPIVRTETLYQQHEMRRAIRGVVAPKIGIVLGPRSQELPIHGEMDMTCYVRRGNETPYELERAAMLCHAVVDSLGAAFDWCADILRYLPRPWEGDSVAGRRSPVAGKTLLSDDPMDRLTGAVADILPAALNQPYEMRDVIAEVFDRSSFREFAPDDRQPLLVGVATLGGRVCGVIADVPNIDAGAQTVVSISKFTRFHRLCVRFGLPIIELNDSPAFRPGREQEQSGIQGEGGKSIREEVLSSIPKIAVTLRQNYGGRYIHANLVTLGPPRSGLILEGARLGVMGAEGAVGVLGAKELAQLKDPAQRATRRAELIAAYERKQLDPQQALDLGYAEAIIHPAQLRAHLHQILLHMHLT